MTARLLLLLASLVLVAGVASAAHPTADLDLQAYHGAEASTNSKVVVAYHAHSPSATTTIATTVVATGCLASPIAEQEAGGREAGTFTLTLGRSSCSFEIISTATEGVDVNVYRYAGTVKVGSTGAVLEEWVPIAIYVAIVVYAGRQGNILGMTFALVGILSERMEVPPVARTGILLLVVASMFPLLFREAFANVGKKFRGE